MHPGLELLRTCSPLSSLWEAGLSPLICPEMGSSIREVILISGGYQITLCDEIKGFVPGEIQVKIVNSAPKISTFLLSPQGEYYVLGVSS